MDVAQVEELLKCAMDALKQKERGRWSECMLQSDCKSLISAYTHGVRLVVMNSGFSEEGERREVEVEEDVWRRLLKITALTGCIIAEMCSTVADGGLAVMNAVKYMMSELLQPPLLEIQKDVKEMWTFWNCYPWWCCLLYHWCVAFDGNKVLELAACETAARAIGWVSRHYTMGAGCERLSAAVDAPSLLSAISFTGCDQTRLLSSTRRGEVDVGSSVGGGNELDAGSMYPLSLGQSFDVGGENLVFSFVRAEKRRNDTYKSSNDNDGDDNDSSSDHHSPDSVTQSVSASPRHGLHSPQRALFVAAKLGTLFILEDLHTLLPLRSCNEAVVTHVPEMMDDDNDDGFSVIREEPHCEACGILEGCFSSCRKPEKEGLIVHSLILLHAVFSRRRCSLSLPVRRCVGEKVAAAVVVALLRCDAKVTDATISVLAQVHDRRGFIYFLALWRATFSLVAKDLSEGVAWLLAGLAHGIKRYATEAADCCHSYSEGIETFLDSVDVLFESIIHAMTALLSSPSTCIVSAAGDGADRLRNLCMRGFLEVWDAVLYAAPRHTGRTPHTFLCSGMYGGDSPKDKTHEAPSSAAAAVRLERFLELYYVSMMERWFDKPKKRIPITTTTTSSLSWWPDVVSVDCDYDCCLHVLRHVLTVTEYISHADDIFHMDPCGSLTPSKHPAAFFLEGAGGLCARLFSMRLEDCNSVQLEELQRVAAQIIAVTARTLCTRPGGNVFLSPFGGSSDHYATTYTRQLYLCFVEKVHRSGYSNYLHLQSLLRALRSLIVLEREAHSSALRLSLPIMLSRMLPGDDVDAEETREETPLREEVGDLNLTSSLVDELCDSDSGDACSCSNITRNINNNNNNNVGEMMENSEGNPADVMSEGGMSAGKPSVPMLALGSSPPPQLYTSNGEVMESTETDQVSSPTVPVKFIPMLPPLKNLKQGRQLHMGEKTTITPTALDDPATLAELLLLLSCMLPGRKGGMISQSGLATAHSNTGEKAKLHYVESVRGNTAFARVLRRMVAFLRHSANKTSAEAFSKLLTREMQRTIPLWLGVDVLGQLLLPQPQLLECVSITRHIGSGSYASVFSATHACSSSSRCQYKIDVGDVGQSLALKMVSVSRPDMQEESFALVSCHTEATALLQLKGHPRICELLFFGCRCSHYVLVMPLYKGGSLRQWRLTRSGFPIAEGILGDSRSLTSEVTSKCQKSFSSRSILSVCGPIFAQILEAVEFMHALCIRHNDLKADNILIEYFQEDTYHCSPVEGTRKEKKQQQKQGYDNQGDMKANGQNMYIPAAIRVCDFGVCEVVGEDAVAARRSSHAGVGGGRTCWWGPTRGTEAVQAPETLSLRRPAPQHETTSTVVNSDAEMLTRELAADMWACGCLLYELLTGVMLFGGASLARLFVLVSSMRNDGSYTHHEVLQPHEKNILDAIGDGVAEFTLQLLSLDSAERPSASAARKRWDDIMGKHARNKNQ